MPLRFHYDMTDVRGDIEWSPEPQWGASLEWGGDTISIQPIWVSDHQQLRWRLRIRSEGTKKATANRDSRTIEDTAQAWRVFLKAVRMTMYETLNTEDNE